MQAWHAKNLQMRIQEKENQKWIWEIHAEKLDFEIANVRFQGKVLVLKLQEQNNKWNYFECVTGKMSKPVLCRKLYLKFV